jgi:hypothetical protein
MLSARDAWNRDVIFTTKLSAFYGSILARISPLLSTTTPPPRQSATREERLVSSRMSATGVG